MLVSHLFILWVFIIWSFSSRIYQKLEVYLFATICLVYVLFNVLFTNFIDTFCLNLMLIWLFRWIRKYLLHFDFALVYSLCFFISVFPICNHYSLLKLVVLLCVSTSTERALRSGSKIFSAAILECLLLYYVCQFDFLAKFRKEGFSADLADHRSFNLSSCDIGLWF